jgi:hypothetical protein
VRKIHNCLGATTLRLEIIIPLPAPVPSDKAAIGMQQRFPKDYIKEVKLVIYREDGGLPVGIYFRYPECCSGVHVIALEYHDRLGYQSSPPNWQHKLAIYC